MKIIRRKRGDFDQRTLGDTHREQGTWPAAAAAYRAHLQQHPDEYDIWVQLGHAEKESGQLAAADEAYKRALQLRNDDPDLFLSLGHLSKIRGSYEAAKGLYEKSWLLDGNAAARAELDALLSGSFPAQTTKQIMGDLKTIVSDRKSKRFLESLFGRQASKLSDDVESEEFQHQVPLAPLPSKGLFGNPKVIAFYLPQYHEVKENSDWWGKGFTEWTNVRRAKPNFVGHKQPRVPLDGKYYDLMDRNVQVNQGQLAKQFGIDAFCYYMYWFNGRRILERPLDNVIKDRNIDQNFCICWANENWTRTWDGKNSDILLQQVHTLESDRDFIKDCLKYLSDPRYLRVDGKLMLLVYRVDLMDNASATAAIWRDEVRSAGLGELHLCAVQFYGITDPTVWGFDAAVEFPPHGWLEESNLLKPTPHLLNQDFKGQIFDYRKAVEFSLRKAVPQYQWYRAAFPGWDNTARRQDTPHIFASAKPGEFEAWLTELLRQQIIMSPPEHQIVFINAWNEWGEGAHLEPDERTGFANLNAVASARSAVEEELIVLAAMSRLRRLGDYEGRLADENALLAILQGKERSIRLLQQALYVSALSST
ncbi:glycoside hydrolase family 99-like domain-containing protein [Lichenihabitans sp. PAMC28606]|uniref:glycoside hydrolase family 99-like domain-containing protein n=1 Tax=Lichenihabitans sp. PAMC28606 TaxID=2880932 RepID=UPI001D0AF488|nr:glycoside hydrolase family 99-like domain-containing protein [Lichenihabitans sp. PAMC28606]UDL93224.1 glycoside hydrolase family 99-like domain-containing protein [Lichenihabitans sp. PAMC28606]